MDHRVKETLSALVDDEATELEIRRLLASSESDDIKAQWQRYVMISELTQQVGAGGSYLNHDDSFCQIDVLSQVAAAIRDDAFDHETDGNSVFDLHANRDEPSDSTRSAGEAHGKCPSASDSTNTASISSPAELNAQAANSVEREAGKAAVHAVVEPKHARSSFDSSWRFPVWLGYAASFAVASVLTAVVMLSQKSDDQLAVNQDVSGPQTIQLTQADRHDSNQWTFDQYQVNVAQKKRLNDLLLRHAGNGYGSPDLGMTAYTRVANYDVQAF